MPAFKELDPELIWKAIEGQKDILSPMVQKEEAFFRNVACPVCTSKNHEAFINASNPFSPGVALPNKLLKCQQCGTEFDAYSQLVTKVTDVSD